jgi:N-acetyltransferase 10
LFDFVCKGINALEYKVLFCYFVLLLKCSCVLYIGFLCLSFLFQEHLHYDVVKSADPELKKATIQINVYKQHRQTIQVIT